MSYLAVMKKAYKLLLGILLAASFSLLGAAEVEAQSGLSIKKVSVLHPTCTDKNDGRIIVKVKGKEALEVQAVCGYTQVVVPAEAGEVELSGLGEGKCNIILMGNKGDLVQLAAPPVLKARSTCFHSTTPHWFGRNSFGETF